MLPLILALIAASCAVSLPLTAALVRVGHRLGTFDSAGVPGQVKAPRRRVPNTGGVAIFWGVALPMLVGLAVVWAAVPIDAGPREGLTLLPAALEPHLDGVREQTPLALALLGSLLLLHVVGLFDDRRPMGPWVKLAVMAAPAVAIPWLFPSVRLLELLNAHVGGPWLSILLTALWMLTVTNAMNFMDNMDGLAAGVAAVASAFFLAATLINDPPQWFVAAVLALVIGSCLGFLVFNFPREGGAKIFMGDGGSLVLGFLLAFLTVRTTYYVDPAAAPLSLSVVAGSTGAWYALFMPLVVLAVPIYDFASVLSIRVAQGKSPFVGDLQHLSHRLTNLGLSQRGAVLVTYGLTAITGISGIALGSLRPWQAALVGVQTILLLGVIALFEYARARSERRVAAQNAKGPSRA
jgi:UDP-GlcNAc:undecaprenyl-phosphate/decaprenyl-phosphate GlcNAc-1-phosphate transferase